MLYLLLSVSLIKFDNFYSIYIIIQFIPDFIHHPESTPPYHLQFLKIIRVSRLLSIYAIVIFQALSLCQRLLNLTRI